MAERADKTARPPQAARSAKQERSRQTLARILTAAEDLLETREFDELTMADLAEHAGCGVGTFYGRLPNKESLLLCLHERYMEAGLAGSASVFEQCRNAGLEERVQRLCAMMVDFFAAHRGVTRAITNYLFARASPDHGQGSHGSGSRTGGAAPRSHHRGSDAKGKGTAAARRKRPGGG